MSPMPTLTWGRGTGWHCRLRFGHGVSILPSGRVGRSNGWHHRNTSSTQGSGFLKGRRCSSERTRTININRKNLLSQMMEKKKTLKTLSGNIARSPVIPQGPRVALRVFPPRLLSPPAHSGGARGPPALHTRLCAPRLRLETTTEGFSRAVFFASASCTAHSRSALWQEDL